MYIIYTTPVLDNINPVVISVRSFPTIVGTVFDRRTVEALSFGDKVRLY